MQETQAQLAHLAHQIAIIALQCGFDSILVTTKPLVDSIAYPLVIVADIKPPQEKP